MKDLTAAQLTADLGEFTIEMLTRGGETSADDFISSAKLVVKSEFEKCRAIELYDETNEFIVDAIIEMAKFVAYKENGAQGKGRKYEDNAKDLLKSILGSRIESEERTGSAYSSKYKTVFKGKKSRTNGWNGF